MKKAFQGIVVLTALVLGLSVAPGITAVGQDNDAPRTTSQRNDDSDDGFDLGWLGLIGLAGLVGLKRRDRDDHNRPGTTHR